MLCNNPDGGNLEAFASKIWLRGCQQLCQSNLRDSHRLPFGMRVTPLCSSHRVVCDSVALKDTTLRKVWDGHILSGGYFSEYSSTVRYM